VKGPDRENSLTSSTTSLAEMSLAIAAYPFSIREDPPGWRWGVSWRLPRPDPGLVNSAKMRGLGQRRGEGGFGCGAGGGAGWGLLAWPCSVIRSGVRVCSPRHPL
jgi:hypothetical protein